MRLEVMNASGGQNEVPEIREKIGRQRIGTGWTGKEGPSGMPLDIAYPVERGEEQNGSPDAIETPGGRSPDLGYAESGESPSRNQCQNTEGKA